VSVGSITNDTWDGSGGATIIGGGFVQPWAVNSGGSGVLEVADVQVWFNQAIDPTPTNLAKFISGGKPVNPVTAASAFGTQGLLFSGNASTFATNLGNVGGTFTVSGDPITNASTSPST
jgi:hypothetical protein